LVAETRPAFYLAENVPGILSKDTQPFIEAALAQVPSDYVRLPPMIVEAQNFGAPTTRKRVFFIGYDPQRISNLSEASFDTSDIPVFHVRDALEGLPRVFPSWQREEQSWREVKYSKSNYFTDRLRGHIPPNVGDAITIARLKNNIVSGFLGTCHTEKTVLRFGLLKPGEVDSVYRSPRLKLNGFCPTLRAGTAADKGSYQAVRPIHPSAPRVIAPREAARLQGFPDWFIFHHTKWHAFRQIGNSVSPLVAERLLRVINSNLSQSLHCDS
jgi:DNA (cytosine-5)-methyltransferase 1